VLRNALGLGPDDTPAHIQQMKIIGYPPGWKESSGLKFVDNIHEEQSEVNLLDVTPKNGPTIYYPGYNLPDGSLPTL